jgi:hypothetical protein
MCIFGCGEVTIDTTSGSATRRHSQEPDTRQCGGPFEPPLLAPSADDKHQMN